MIDAKKLAEKIKREGIIGVEFTEEEAETLGCDILTDSNLAEQGYISEEAEDEEFLKKYVRANEVDK